MKFKKKALVALSALLLLSSPITPFLPASEVQALNNESSFTLTQQTDTQIMVTMNNTPSVMMPNGTLTSRNRIFTVPKNGTYTFIGIDGQQKGQKSITMTNVPDDTPLLMVAPGEDVFLNFESGDAHSGVEHMRYIAYNEDSGQTSADFSAWEPYVSKKAWKVPMIPAQSSAMYVIKAEFRDVAGNVSTGVIGKFFIDNEAPGVSIAKTKTYTNQPVIQVIASILTKHENPEQGFISRAGVPETTYDLNSLTNLAPGGNVDGTRSFEYSIPYTLPNAEGVYDVFFKASKRQKNTTLMSETVSKQVVFDKTAPTGSVVINNGEDVVPSNEVKLTIKTQDNVSNVDKIKITETSASGTTKEIFIDDPKATEVIDWTLYVEDTAQVTVVIYDNAGNMTTILSQIVSFVKLNIVGLELTNNRNPKVYHAAKPFQVRTWDWEGNSEIMLAGSTFDFNVYYDLGLGQSVDYKVTGKYTVQVRTTDGSYNVSKTYPFTSTKPIVNGFAGEHVAIPADAPEGALVFLAVELDAAHKTNPTVKSKAMFEGNRQIGRVGKTLSQEVNGMIEFNEIN